MKWFREPKHGGIALVAVDDQRDIVGYVAGAPLGYAKALSRHLFWTSAAATIAHPAVILSSRFRHGLFDRLRLGVTGNAQQTSMPVLPEPTMSLVVLGVSLKARRQNIGRRLVEDFERRAREMGIRSMRLSTQSDNFTSRKFFECCGWHLLTEAGGTAFYCRMLNP
jgi:ribosomal protein S18 acetylase RimI-like enzyme